MSIQLKGNKPINRIRKTEKNFSNIYFTGASDSFSFSNRKYLSPCARHAVLSQRKHCSTQQNISLNSSVSVSNTEMSVK